MKLDILFSKILFLIVLFFGPLNLHANNVLQEEFWEGAIFMKIADDSDLFLPDYDGKDTKLNRDYPLIQHLLVDYDIQKISRPFSSLKTPVFDRTYKIEFNATSKTDALMRALNKLEAVAYTEKIPVDKINASPNDPFSESSIQWYLSTVQAYEAWDLGVGSKEIVIAVVDDAVKIGHEDLFDNIWVNTGEIPNNGIDDDGNGYIDDVNGWDAAHFDGNPNPPAWASDIFFSHGTHCAGTAAGVTNNGRGIAAISHNVSLMPVKGARDSDYALIGVWEGVLYAINNNANIISCSWGSYTNVQTFQNIIDEAYSRNITIFAAAGNDNVSDIFYPCGYNHVICVGSSAPSDIVSGFSNFGQQVDIYAPGSEITSATATSNSSYFNYSGTSMATPNTASLAALLLSQNPSLGPDDILSCLISGADNISDLNPNYGNVLRINALGTMLCINTDDCLIPVSLNVVSTSANVYTLSWSDITSAVNYNVRYRVVGEDWTSPVLTTTNSLDLTNLNPCTPYEFQVQSNCGAGDLSDYSAIDAFNVYAADGFSYCAARGLTSNFEWIAAVNLNTINNTSENNDGYQNFTCQATALNQGDSYAVSLSPGFFAEPFPEYWKVFIDYNQDGVFDNAEVAFESATTNTAIETGNITIPATALTGFTTMRVIMKCVGPNDPGLPTACGSFQFGEVEDYGINIIGVELPPCDMPTNLLLADVGATTANISWTAVAGATSYNIRIRPVGTTEWNSGTVTANETNLSTMGVCTDYEIQVQTNCGANNSGYTESLVFSTEGCAVEACTAPNNILLGATSINSISLSWEEVPGALGYVVEYRLADTGIGVISTTETNMISLTGLAPCMDYQFRVATTCEEGATSEYSDFMFFTTECMPCNPPQNLSTSLLTESSVIVTWEEVPNALSYDVRAKSENMSFWLELNVLDFDVFLENADPCTQWEFQVRTVCVDEIAPSAYSEPFYITLAGCDDGYCIAQAQTSTYEWISGVSIGDYSNTSGNDGGYGDYTNSIIDLSQGETYDASFSPGFAATPFQETWTVWIDWNQDLSFSENEIAFGTSDPSSAIINGGITVPADAMLGTTRMRVMMKFVNSGQFVSVPQACLSYSYGEVEDYTINIIEQGVGASNSLAVRVKLMLEGAYNNNTDEPSMTTHLRANNLLPNEQPFNTAPWFYNGNESAAILPNEAVNWVLVEIRNANYPYDLEARNAALLLADGTVVGTNSEIDAIHFPDLNSGEYHIIVRARGHLDVMSARAVSLPNMLPYDFTNAANIALETKQLKTLGNGVFALYAGDIDNNGVINFADFNAYQSQQNNSNQYNEADCNMDGQVNALDYDLYQPNARVIGRSEIRY